MNTGGQLSVCGKRKEAGGSGDLQTGGPGTPGVLTSYKVDFTTRCRNCDKSQVTVLCEHVRVKDHDNYCLQEDRSSVCG